MKTLRIRWINNNCVEFTGPDVLELHRSVANGRPPWWNVRTRRWTTSPRRAKDLVAAAESKGYRVVDDGLESEAGA